MKKDYIVNKIVKEKEGLVVQNIIHVGYVVGQDIKIILKIIKVKVNGTRVVLKEKEARNIRLNGTMVIHLNG